VTIEIEPAEDWMAWLSAKGRQTADAVAAEQSRHDLVGLVSAWVATVRWIAGAQGEDYYDDYFGYLCWRDSIDEVVAALPEADASIVLKAVEPADARFKDSTFDDGGVAMSRKSFRIRTDRWYWRRVPVRGPIARSLGVEEGRSPHEE
jgi:hypothetical protein